VIEGLKMKKLCLILLSLIILSCNSSTEPGLNLIVYQVTEADDSSLPVEVKNNYLEDAYRLSLREIQKKNSLKTQTVEIPKESAMMYYNGLIHIYNATLITARDSVVNLFSIHTFPQPRFNEFAIGVTDTNLSWVKKWRNGEIITGNKEMDDLINKYSITIKDSHKSFPLTFLMKTPQKNNLDALCLLFSKFQGVRFAEPNGYVGDGNDITADANDGKIKYKFRLAWGDCPAGCTASHFWEFEVNLNGEVKYIGSSGLPVLSMR
jgi:hypothetical protein